VVRFESGHVLAEVLNDLEKTSGIFFDLEKLCLELFNLHPVVYSHLRGRDCHAQGDAAKNF
jgi:hypothetical protein